LAKVVVLSGVVDWTKIETTIRVNAVGFGNVADHEDDVNSLNAVDKDWVGNSVDFGDSENVADAFDVANFVDVADVVGLMMVTKLANPVNMTDDNLPDLTNMVSASGFVEVVDLAHLANTPAVACHS
jgi:hypothetical protein